MDNIPNHETEFLNHETEFLNRKQVEDKIKSELSDYRRFAFKENMVQAAVAFVIATAFNKMVTTFTESFIMPIIKLIIGGPTESWRQMQWEPYPGLAFEVGKFTGTFIDFFIISILMYIIYMKIIKKYENQELAAQEAAPKTL